MVMWNCIATVKYEQGRDLPPCNEGKAFITVIFQHRKHLVKSGTMAAVACDIAKCLSFAAGDFNLG